MQLASGAPCSSSRFGVATTAGLPTARRAMTKRASAGRATSTTAQTAALSCCSHSRRAAYTEPMASTPKDLSLPRHCTRKLGIHRGALAVARVSQWAMVTAELGHVATTVEYAEWWAISERTGWYHRALIQEALGDQWPEIVTKFAEVIVARQVRSPRAAMKLAVEL